MRIRNKLCSSLLLLSAIHAIANFEFRSTYLGDGLFKYQLNVQDSPFLADEIVDINHINFSNLIEVVEYSPGWNFDSSSNSISLSLPSVSHGLNRPYSAYCIVKSSYTNFTLASDQAMITGGFESNTDEYGLPFITGGGPVSKNIVFFMRTGTLIPCSQQSQLEYNSTYSEYHQFTPTDLTIGSNMIIEDGLISGFDIAWERNCTVLIQSSTNLIDWIDIEHALVYAPSSEWKSSTPLDDHGNYFRVLLIAQGHRPELVD